MSDAGWWTGADVLRLGTDLGLTADEIAAEIGVPVWQLHESSFRALPHQGGGWETEMLPRWEGPSIFAAAVSCLLVAVPVVLVIVGAYVVFRRVL